MRDAVMVERYFYVSRVPRRVADAVRSRAVRAYGSHLQACDLYQDTAAVAS